MVALFVAITFILFIVIDIFVLKVQRKKHPALVNSAYSVFNKKSFHLPEGILVSKGHTWAKILKDGLVEIGIDDFATKALGKLSIISLAKEGTEIKSGDIIFQAAVGRKGIKFRSPVDGYIKTANSDLIGKILDNPYGNWGITVIPAGIEKNKINLFEGKQLTEWLKNEMERLKDFLSLNSAKVELAGVTMHDGGNIMEGAVANINEDGIQSFEKEFLTF